MKLIIFGDPHGNVNVLDEVIGKENPDYVLSTGDLSVYKECKVPHYFIHGNHEDFKLLKSLDKGKLVIRNLHHMKTGRIYALEKGTEIVKVAGLNGNYSPTFRERERHFTKEEIESCIQLKGVDIFLSHEAPSDIGFKKGHSSGDLGIEAVKQILDAVKPKYFIFGHHHKFWNTLHHRVKIIGMGYAKEGYLKLDINDNKLFDTLIKKYESKNVKK